MPSIRIDLPERMERRMRCRRCLWPVNRKISFEGPGCMMGKVGLMKRPEKTKVREPRVKQIES